LQGALLMTAHDPALQWPEQAPAHAAASRLVRPLAWLAAMSIVAAVSCFALFGPERHAGSTIPAPPGAAGVVTGSLLLAALGLIASLLMELGRGRRFVANGLPISLINARPSSLWLQTILALLMTGMAACAIIIDWPWRPPASVPPDVSANFPVASALLLLATPWLLAERYIATLTPQRLPEADDLRALLFLPVFCLATEVVLQVADAFGFGNPHWLRAVLSIVLLLVSSEIALRAMALRFLPPSDSATARAPIRSLLATVLRGRSLSPGAVSSVVRSQFGMDFSRSWALRFMRTAALPVMLLMLAFCWFLTGVTRIDLNQRGSYERFGVAASMLPPGLHLVLPWPFGIVRHLELGVIHSTLISFDAPGATTDGVDGSTAEGTAPASANRLWDSEQPSDVSYVIASGEQNRQSLQTVSVSARVLFRIGISDDDARAALYREADPDALVHSLTSRMLAQFFAGQTLPSVIGENQAVIAGEVRTRLRQALDRLGSGIDVVAVVIEAIHPPSGAASAYRNVQAAEIEATTSIATEHGRAQTTESVARLNAHNATDDAAAMAAETVSAARVDLTGITADHRPYHLASQPFLLERYFSDVKTALGNVPLEIIDHRLSDASLPTIDLRPLGAIRDSAGARPTRPATQGDAPP
jgi:regulator of protease activity HflC (stomatin/prohibitin superfamily)